MRALITGAILLFSLLLLTSYTETKTTKFYFEKHAVNKEWIYLDQFAFDELGAEKPGIINWEFYDIDKKDPNALRNLSILLYDDQDYSWPKMWEYINNQPRDNVSCVELRKYAKRVFDLNAYPKISIEIEEGNIHFWYLALDACDRDSSAYKGQPSSFIEMTFNWLNPGSFFQQQFSKDRQGLLEIHITFVPLYTIMTLVYLFSVVQLFRARSLHFIIRIFYASLVSYWFGRILELIHLVKYGYDGDGIPFFDDMAIAFKLVADFLMILLLLLIASGWTVTTSYIRYFKWISTVAVIFGVFYLALFTWAQIQLALVVTTEDYIYDTVPGIMIAALRVPTAAFFLFVLIKTHKEETNTAKLIFYKVVGALYTVWFISLPIIVIISFAVKASYRAKVVEGISLSVDLLSYVGMVIILWYSLAKKYFQLSEDTQGNVYENL
ncbi:hypothetical protein ABK040_011664 [Willaertia magna]